MRRKDWADYEADRLCDLVRDAVYGGEIELLHDKIGKSLRKTAQDFNGERITGSVGEHPRAKLTEPVESTFKSLAKALVFFESRVEEIAKALSGEEIKAVIKRCRRAAHPESVNGYSFEMLAWDRIVDLLERELHLRCKIDELLKVEARDNAGTDDVDPHRG